MNGEGGGSGKAFLTGIGMACVGVSGMVETKIDRFWGGERTDQPRPGGTAKQKAEGDSNRDWRRERRKAKTKER